MILLIGYDETRVIHREEGKVMVELPNNDDAIGCYLATAEGTGLAIGGHVPKSRRTIYVGIKGGMHSQPKKPKGAYTYRCPHTIPIPFPEVVEEEN